MRRVTVGYQEGGLHPLWLSRVSMRLAVSFGASALWLPDHFMSFTPPHVWRPEVTPAAKFVPSMDALHDPFQLLAITAKRIRRVDLGTSVTEAFRRHPVALAQAFVTLDHLSKGRAILGIGNGIRENTEPYGLVYEKQLARLEEALAVIRAVWGSGGVPVTRDGRFWPLRDAIFGLPLYKGRSPRLFVGAHYPRMLRLVGRYADGWLPGQKVSPAEYRVRLDVIRAAAAEAGRSMENFLPTQTLLVALGASQQQVLERAMRSRFCAALSLGAPDAVWQAHGREHPLGPGFGGFLDLVPTRVTEAQVDTAARTMTPEILLSIFHAGSPAEISAEVTPLADAGCRHFILANVGATFAGDVLSDLWRLRDLMRRLRRV